MENKIFFSKLRSGVAVMLLLVGSVVGMFSCTDKIDDSNLVTKTEATVWDYLDSVSVYSDYAAILKEVQLGEGDNVSPLSSFVASYGNYTCFAPDNDAIRAYVLDETNGETSDWHNLSDDQKKAIAYNSIINNGDDDAYSTAEFPTTGSFTLANLNDRLLTVELLEDNTYKINGTSIVVRPDVKLKNGYIQGVDVVISPSTATIGDLIEAAGNMKIMALLLKETGWLDSLNVAYVDENFSTDGYSETGKMQYNADPISLVDKRYIGFTGFVEPDSVFEAELGIRLQVDEAGEITNKDEILSAIKTASSRVYTDATESDLKAANNAVNRFVAYHFLDGSMAYNKLVMHMNEYGYKFGSDVKNPQLSTLSVDVWDYYTTMGQTRCLLKITQDAADPDHPIYLNRKCTYDNATTGNYKVTSVVDRGVLISQNNGEYANNARNGFYYPIDKLLWYDTNVRESVLNERIRFDVTSLLPELWTLSQRGAYAGYYTNNFFKNIINVTESSNLFYLKAGWGGSGTNWFDYQGDEFMCTGVYDLTIKLPPVPRQGTYEIRMAASLNALRGMAQIYFGDNPNSLLPTGLPLDLRLTNTGYADFSDYKDSKPELYAVIPWETDVDDEETNRIVDKNLRNQGWMKGPQYYNGITNERQAREDNACLRRIITTQEMSPDKTYYIRFKSALESTDGQFFIDYFEIVPSNIYNGAEPEDIW